LIHSQPTVESKLLKHENQHHHFLNNKMSTTLNRHPSMMNSNQLFNPYLQQQQQQLLIQNGTLPSDLDIDFINKNKICQQYIDFNMNAPQNSQQQATTAYLVQTATGSALLIPPQTALNPTNHYIQTNTATLNQQQQFHNYQLQGNSFTLNRHPSSVTGAVYNTNGLNNNNESNSANNFRPDSTASTNVYQTIDTEK
jgi:hypothetical protein